jgi:hypothetical protein
VSRIIEVTVDPRGQVRVQTRGFAGPGCREASRPLEQALGARTSETRTAEYHQSQEAGQDLRQSS